MADHIHRIHRIHCLAHALRRMAQRKILHDDVLYVLAYGSWHCKPGRHGRSDRCEVTLSRRHIPEADRSEYGHLAGLVVITDGFGEKVITVYRARARETDLRLPYMRDKTHWRSYLDACLLANAV